MQNEINKVTILHNNNNNDNNSKHTVMYNSLKKNDSEPWALVLKGMKNGVKREPTWLATVGEAEIAGG